MAVSVPARRTLAALALLSAVAACEAVAPGAPSPAPEAAPEAALPAPDCAALVVIEAEDTAQGYAREAAWIEARAPGAVILSRSPERCGETPVNRVTYEAGGARGVVLFDTSSFFGKVKGDDLDDLLDG